MKRFFVYCFFFWYAQFLDARLGDNIDTLKKTFKVGEPRKSCMTKLFFHKGILTDRLICYFDNEPLCMPHPIRSNDSKRQSVELFLPLSVIKNHDLRRTVNEVNQNSNNEYKITISEVKMPLEGLKISINYDPQSIVCEFAPHPSIKAEPGWVVSLHHKKVLDTLAVKSEKIFHTAALNAAEKPKIMLDFGHGGADNGKIAYGNIKEKDINLQVGTKVAQLLRSKGYNVYLTRAYDIFVPLDKRTLLANKQNAHIFVSIHANSSPSTDVTGIETYWSSRTFNPTTFLAEPTTQKIVKTVMNRLNNASKLLADKIHTNVLEIVKNKYEVKDRRIRESLAQVLIGPDMPAALIEIGFLSNPQETVKLQDPHYQLLLAQGISKGIDDYCTTMLA